MDLKTLRGRILIAVITLAALLAETACLEPPAPPTTTQGGISTQVSPQTESSAGNAAAPQSTRQRILTTPEPTSTSLPAATPKPAAGLDWWSWTPDTARSMSTAENTPPSGRAIDCTLSTSRPEKESRSPMMNYGNMRPPSLPDMWPGSTTGGRWSYIMGSSIPLQILRGHVVIWFALRSLSRFLSVQKRTLI